MGDVASRMFVDLELKLIRYIFDRSKCIEPMIVLVKGDGRTVTPLSFQNDDQKDIVTEGIKVLVKMTDPDIVVYMCEACCVKRTSKDIDELRPSDHPNRIEMVIVRIEFKTGEKYDCSANIIRKEEEVLLSEFEVLPGEYTMGRFVDFYPIGKAN
jgi:hypothetical protein